VYQPNIRSAVQKSYDMTLRSRVIKVAGDKANVDSFQINSLGQVHTPVLNSDELEIDPNDIIVLDTPETVVNMLHYIDQAENKQHLLITHSLSFFENTVLPTVEWMQSLIQEQLSSQSVQEGESCYEEIKAILPELFSNELRAGVGS
jgi:hypothetical protein